LANKRKRKMTTTLERKLIWIKKTLKSSGMTTEIKILTVMKLMKQR
jgi:hypothetical protein